MKGLEQSPEIQTVSLAERRARMEQYDRQVDELKKQGPVRDGTRDIDKRYAQVATEAITYFMTHFTQEEQLNYWYDKMPPDQKALIDGLRGKPNTPR